MTTNVVLQESEAFLDACKLYKDTSFPQTKLCADILEYATYHYAYCSPTCIILAKVVEGRGWFIHLAVSKEGLKRFFELAPFKLPFIGFARHGKEVKWYHWQLVHDLCYLTKM